MITTTTIFATILFLIVFSFLFDSWLDYLNHTHYKKPLPLIVKDVYDISSIEKQKDYHLANYKMSTITSVLSFLVTLVVILGFVLPWFDSIVTGLSDHEFIRAAIFFGVIGLITQLFSLPFSIYETFVIEEKFGFNKSTPKTFILDIVKSMLLSVIIGGVLLFVIIWFWQVTGSWFWIFSWAIFSFFSMFMMLFYSSLIVPLFNKQKPLEDGELRKAIETFAQKVNFSVNNIFVIDASTRSSKTNAYFSGWGSKKRIVLYDTLIEKHSTEEIVAILAHEIGHYKHKHTLLGALMSILSMGLFLFVFGLFANYPIFSKALGFAQHSFHSSIIAFVLLIEPLSLVTGIISSIISRRFEYQADQFVVDQKLGEQLSKALKKLSADNLSNVNPHPWYVFVHYSHPPLYQRLMQLYKN